MPCRDLAPGLGNPNVLHIGVYVSVYCVICSRYLVEISPGLGNPNVLRIGLMGYNANTGNARLMLKALREGIQRAKGMDVIQNGNH